jgi:hypothetical protein
MYTHVRVQALAALMREASEPSSSGRAVGAAAAAAAGASKGASKKAASATPGGPDLQSAAYHLVKAQAALALVQATAGLAAGAGGAAAEGVAAAAEGGVPGFNADVNRHLLAPAPPRVVKVKWIQTMRAMQAVEAMGGRLPQQGLTPDLSSPPPPPPHHHRPTAQALTRDEAWKHYASLLAHLQQAVTVAAVKE